MNLDFTLQGRRPSAKQIVAQWKAHSRPDSFTVEYGETFAEFTLYGRGWADFGNGCRGIDRQAVVNALNAATGPVAPRDWLG